jgi:hypothetical protein
MLPMRPSKITLVWLITIFMATTVCTSGSAQQTTDRAKSPYSVELPTTKQTSPLASFKIELSPGNAKPGEIVTLKIKASIAKSWHIYPIAASDKEAEAKGMPTVIEFTPTGLEPVDKAFVQNEETPHSGYLEGEFGWIRKYRVSKNANAYSGSGSVMYQACDASKCVPPKTLKFQIGNASNNESVKTKSKSSQNFANAIKLITEPCQLTRPQAKFEMDGLSIFSMPNMDPDPLVKKCEIEVQGEKINIYLPKAESFSIENTDSDNTKFGNTSTYISIDQNRNGKLEDCESTPASLPVRILDTMYSVVAIAKDGSSISLVKTDGPLHGVVVNRRCPEFSFASVNGETITDKSILGKVTVLDIWGVT